MSQENVEIVRAVAICTSGLGNYAVIYSADFEWADADIGSWRPERRTQPGMEGAGQFLADGGVVEEWELPLRKWTMRATRAVALFREFGRGRTSGLDLAQMHPLSAGVFHVRDGTGSRDSSATSTSEALEAVGLRE